MRLILVRHAEPAWPEGWVDDDVGLTDRGRIQADCVAGVLTERFAPAESVTSVLSSPARRAQDTATIIADRLGQALSLDDRLDGVLSGQLRRKVYETGIDDDLLAYAREIQERAWESVQQLVETSDPEANVIAISHDVTIAALVCRTLGMPIEDMRRLRVDPASITILSFTPRRTLLALLNETCYLSATDSP